MKTLAALLLLICGVFSLNTAKAATVTLPSVTFTTSASTSIACVQTSASLAVPVAAGTVIFSCTVSPSGWSGVITASLNAPFAVSGLSGNTFNIVVSSQVTSAGTVAPGSVSSAP
jgi:hypothetical protein